MDKRNFLKATGMLGIASLVPMSKSLANGGNHSDVLDTCTLIPTETAGPFPLDLTDNSFFFRKDVTESKQGVPLNLKLKIIGQDNCEAMPNLRVNIWHCDKDGLYSGYSQNNNQGQAGLTYLRGYQFTDSNGIVEFDTIFPGWYNGRICHIHFQVYVSTSYSAVSQLTFDINSKNAIYSANSSIYTKGIDPMSIQSDNIFSDGYAYQLASLTLNEETGGYDAYLEVVIKGTGTGIGHLEKENAKQFLLAQNYPNPFVNDTVIPFYLKEASDISLEIWDLNGKKLTTIHQNNLFTGEHEIHLNFQTLGLERSNYVYQFEVRNNNGIFRDCKMMTSSSK